MSDLLDNHFENVDPNGRLSPVVDNVSLTRDNKVQRLVDIAVPFFCLYRPTAFATNVALSTVKSIQIIQSLPHQKNKIEVCKQLANLALTISTLALSIIMPAVGIGVSQFYSVCLQVDRLRVALQGKNYKEAAEAAANIALSVLYVASVVTAAPEVTVISILAQAAFELYQASGEFRKGKGRFLEGMAKVAMAAVRLSQAAPMIKDLHRDYFGKQITQADLDRYMQQIRINRKRDEAQETITSNVTHRGHEGYTTLDEFASIHNYSRKINNLKFFDTYIENESYNKFRFTNCEFTEMTFKKCTFNDVKFTDCTLDETFFWNCDLKNISFINSVFEYHSMFFGSNLSHVTFNNCDLTRLNFTDAHLYKTNFEKSEMTETCFLGSSVKACKIKDCYLTDTLFCGTEKEFKISGGTPHKITKPVVGILWDHTDPQTYASFGFTGLVKGKAIPLKIDYRLFEIDQNALETQVDNEILKIRQMNRHEYLSIGDQMLNSVSSNSEIAKISHKAHQAIKFCNGIYLPGGEDIAEQFYKLDSQAFDKSDYARSVLESVILKEAFSKDLPILAICRGAQMLNVYHGGTLHHELDGHGGVVHEFQFDATVPQDIYEMTKTLTGNDPKFMGLSAHSQGCDKIGQGLHVTMRSDDGLPECLISSNRQAIGTQFHPEYIFAFSRALFDSLGSMNHCINFFNHFIGLAKEHRQSQMELA